MEGYKKKSLKTLFYILVLTKQKEIKIGTKTKQIKQFRVFKKQALNRDNIEKYFNENYPEFKIQRIFKPSLLSNGSYQKLIQTRHGFKLVP